MDKKYVQLPPLPLDLPLESVMIIWLYAGMPEQEKEFVMAAIQKQLGDNRDDTYEKELNKVINDSQLKTSQDIMECASLMQKLVKKLAT